MRTLLLAVILFIAFHFIRMDLAEGTIPLASFAAKSPTTQCEEQDDVTTITVTTVAGDTIETLLALYPDPEQSFIERLNAFYSFNPHLKNQQLIGGVEVLLPITQKQSDSCTESNQ